MEYIVDLFKYGIGFVIGYRLHKNRPKKTFHFLKVGPSGMIGVIVEQLSTSESIKFTVKAKLILPEKEIEGEMLLSDLTLYFVANDNQPQRVDHILTLSWKVTSITEIHRRR